MAATKHAQLIKQDSQNYLTTALFQLLQTKDLNTITVAQVVRRAGVSRMAFYRNFETLADLLTAYFEPKISARFTDIMNKVPNDQKLAALGDFFIELADTFKLADQRGFEPIIQKIFNQNIATFYASSIPTNQHMPAEQKYWIKFMSAGVYAIWREWLLSGQKESLTEIHTIISHFQSAELPRVDGED